MRRRGPDQRHHRRHGNMLGIGVDVGQRADLLDGQGRPVRGDRGRRGSREAARVIEGVPNVEVVAEFAFGTSDKSPLGSPSEKGRIGNVHFALGDNQNAYPGGQNSARSTSTACSATRPWRSRTPAATSSATGSGTSGRPRRPARGRPPIELPGGSWSRVILPRAIAARSGSRSSRRPGRARAATRPRSWPTSSAARASCGSMMTPSRSAKVGAVHPGRRLARGRQHGRRGREHGLRLPTSRLPADGAPMTNCRRRARDRCARRSPGLPGHRARGLRRTSPSVTSAPRAGRQRDHLHQAQGTRPRRGRA